jgi:hypothetical protein
MSKLYPNTPYKMTPPIKTVITTVKNEHTFDNENKIPYEDKSSAVIAALSFDGKPSPDNPDRVLRRHQDTTAEQSNPRTPTLVRSSDVLANTELKTKDQLIEKIKEWVKIDNEIRVLQKEQRKRLTDKKKVSVELIAVMRTNEIDAFDLNDGQILYDKRNMKKPITKTALLSILTTYYKGDVVKASETNQYILDNREEVVREKIVRKIAKPVNTKTQNK